MNIEMDTSVGRACLCARPMRVQQSRYTVRMATWRRTSDDEQPMNFRLRRVAFSFQGIVSP